MQEEQDARLLHLLLTDSISVPVLLHWLDAHHGPGPPPASPPADQSRFHSQVLSVSLEFISSCDLVRRASDCIRFVVTFVILDPVFTGTVVSTQYMKFSKPPGTFVWL